MDTDTYIQFKDQEVPLYEIVELIYDLKEDYSEGDDYYFHHDIEDTLLTVHSLFGQRKYSLYIYLDKMKNIPYMSWIDKYLFVDLDILMDDVWGPAS